MPMQLTETQRAFLSNPDRVRALARWIIASATLTYPRQLCVKLRVPQGNKPTDQQIATVGAYLKAPDSDMGIVARLINQYRNTHAERP